MEKKAYRIAAFYEFKKLEELPNIRERLHEAMENHSVFGTIIIAAEGYNATVSGSFEEIEDFIPVAERILESSFDVKTSFHDEIPFRRRKVKLKKEIVTLRKEVDLSLGEGSHVNSHDWNRLIRDPETLVLDTRNEYEVEVGRFRNAHDPGTRSFSELPEAVNSALEKGSFKRIAMYCTGGIRCEKFAPYMKQIGFDEVYQLKGGILRYLEDTRPEESLWDGECFVFDERVSVDEDLSKGDSADPSFFKNKQSD